MTFQPLFEDQGIPLAIMGMFVVFAALVLVSLFITYLPTFMNGINHWYPSEKATAVSEKPKRDEITEEEIAVITAAAMSVLGPGYRIVHINRGVPGDVNWSMEGRRQHHASHQPSLKKS